MIKRFLPFLILPFLLSFSSMDNNEIKSFSFLGYKENKPVFYEATSGNLVIKSGNKLEEIGNFNSSKRPVFIHDDLIVFEMVVQNKYSITLSKFGKEKEFPVEGKIYYIAGDENQVFYTNIKDMDIWKTSLNENKQTNLKGFVSGYDNECLYFNKEHDPEIIGANADIYKYDTNDQGQLSKVANNLSGEMTYILPGGQLIFDQILYDGKYRPSITNVNTGKFTILSVEGEYGDCYYSYELDALVFYDPSTLESEAIKIPKEFNLLRKQP